MLKRLIYVHLLLPLIRSISLHLPLVQNSMVPHGNSPSITSVTILKPLAKNVDTQFAFVFKFVSLFNLLDFLIGALAELNFT